MDMRPVDPDVFVGRNPAWKEAWEEDLTDDQRRQVRRAVVRGRRLDDPKLAPYLSGLLAQALRSLRWSAVLLIAMFSMWLTVGIVSKSSFGHWYGFGLASVISIGGAVSLLIRRYLLVRAHRLNFWTPRPRESHKDAKGPNHVGVEGGFFGDSSGTPGQPQVGHEGDNDG